MVKERLHQKNLDKKQQKNEEMELLSFLMPEAIHIRKFVNGF